VRSRTADLIGAALLIALGATMAIASIGYELFVEGGRIGPGLMPFTAGLLLIVFGGAVGAESLRSSRHQPHSESAEGAERKRESASDTEDPPDGDRHEAQETSWNLVALVFALTLSGILLVPLLGFLAPFALLIFVLVALVERQGWVPGAVLGLTATAITWLIFVRLLQIPLPTGILEAVLGI
jgi:hypothetical protein